MGAVDHLFLLGSAAPLATTVFERGAEALANLSGRLVIGRGGSQQAAAEPATPAEAIDLLDMTVPPDVLTVVEPALAEFDIRVEPTTRSNAVYKNAKMHLAVNGSFSTYLLHFRKEILADARWAREVIGYSSLFQKGDRVHVLSKDSQDFEPAYEWAWKIWSQFGVATRYVEWRHIARMKLDQAQRADLLQIAFDLPPTLKRRGQREPEDLVASEGFKRLTTMLAELGAASGNSDVNGYFNNLLIGPVPQEMRRERTTWGTGYQPGAREFLAWLHTKGRRPDGDTYLGAVLLTLLDQLSVEACTLVIEAVEQYKLIGDADVVTRAREKYLPSGRT